MKKMVIPLKSILFFLGWAVLLAFIPDPPIYNTAILRLWWEIVPLGLVVFFTVLFIKVFDKGKIKISFFNKIFQNIILGFGIGIIWLGSVILILMGLGVMRFESKNIVPYLSIWILASFFNVIMQELLIRGYLYQLFKYNFNIVTAFLITTALFTVLHGGAFEAGVIAVLNMLTMSIFVTILLEYTDSLFVPIIVHFFWNTIAGIGLGVVSLADDYPHFINTVLNGNELLTGGIYKIEGSIVVLIVNILFIIFFAYLNKKHKATLTA